MYSVNRNIPKLYYKYKHFFKFADVGILLEKCKNDEGNSDPKFDACLDKCEVRINIKQKF